MSEVNDLISRSALLKKVLIPPCNVVHVDDIKSAPAVDAVEVVRCKDCKHYMTIHCICDGCCISDYWFCAAGERRSDDGR